VTNSDAALLSIKFVDADLGWAVGGGGSTVCVGDCDEDGEVTIDEIIIGVAIAQGLQPISACPEFDPNGDMFVTIEEILQAVNNAQNGCPEGEGVILHTTNGGGTWRPQTSNTTRILNGVSFVDNQTGWIVGDQSTILHTTNGGATWTPQQSSQCFGGPNDEQPCTANSNCPMGFCTGTQPLFGISCVEQTCWAVGGTPDEEDPIQVILKTTNGGTTWVAQDSEIDPHDPLFAVHAFDNQRVWAVGDFGLIASSTDGGTNWEIQDSGGFDPLSAVVFSGAQNGWVVGDRGTILVTTSGGQ